MIILDFNNINYHTTPYDMTDEVAEYIALNAEVRCTKLESLKYICAEHEYLNKIGLNIYAEYPTYTDKFDFEEMLDYISVTAKLSKRKTKLFRKAEKLYLGLLNRI